MLVLLLCVVAFPLYFIFEEISENEKFLQQEKFLRDVEKHTVLLTNDERESRDLSKLTEYYSITYAAISHSEDQINQNYAGHVNPQNIGPDKRGKWHGFKYCGNATLVTASKLRYDQSMLFMDTLHNKPYYVSALKPLFEKYEITGNTFDIKQITGDDELSTLLRSMHSASESFHSHSFEDSSDFTTSGFSENTFSEWRNMPYTSPSNTAKVAVDGFMNSPGHKENLLNPVWSLIGVGAAIKQYDNGTVRFTLTQNFC